MFLSSVKKKKDLKKNVLVTRQLTVAISCIIVHGLAVWLPTFFKISYFVFNRRNTFKQVWNNLRFSFLG